VPLIVLFISLQIICGEAFTLQREREGEGELIYSCSNNAYSLRTPIYHSLAVGISTACSLGVVSADTTTAWVKQEFVRPRWPYDMRPSVRAEKYMCVIVIR